MSDYPALRMHTELVVDVQRPRRKHTLDTHCPLRSIREGLQAPVAITTRSAGYLLPSLAMTPTQRFDNGSMIGRSNVPDLQGVCLTRIIRRHRKRTYCPNTILTPNRFSSLPTESTASFAAPHPALKFQIPCHPSMLAFAR